MIRKISCLQYACKNRININKLDNKAKSDNKTLILCRLYKTISMDISNGGARSAGREAARTTRE